jgi:hypothetical protein
MELSLQFTEEGKRTLQSIHIDNQREIKHTLKGTTRDLGIGKALSRTEEEI